MNSKINSKKVLIILLSLAIITIILTSVVYKIHSNEGVVKYKEIPMHIKVTNSSTIGFNTQTDALYFGTVPAGYGSSVRKFYLTNDLDYEVVVKIMAQGDELAQWVRLNSNNTFNLKPHEVKNIEITADVPNNTIVKEYNASLIIKMFKLKIKNK